MKPARRQSKRGSSYRRLLLSLSVFGACVVLTVAVMTWLAGQQPADATVELTAEEADAYSLALTGAALPDLKLAFWGQQRIGATTHLYLQFQSTRPEVERFLRAAPNLPDILDPAVRPGVILNPMPGVAGWQPVRLRDTLGLSETWIDGTDEITVHILTGRQEGNEYRDVYMIFVVTGLAE